MTGTKLLPAWMRSAGQIGAVVLLVLVGKGAVAEPFYVPSGSMEPTLLIGDALLASKYPYGYSAASLPMNITIAPTRRVFAAMPRRGDVVVFRWPGDPSQVWVKRVVGLPGDRIQMRGGQLFINDQPAQLRPDGEGRSEDEHGDVTPATRYIEALPDGRSHAILKVSDNRFLDNTREVMVPEDRLFVLGDNRDNSADSRVPVSQGGVGLLPVENLVGRVDTVVGSWDFAARNQPFWSWLSGLRFARFFTSVN